MTGAAFLARCFAGYGVTHVFFVPTILSDTLVQLEQETEVARILTHGEKAAAYMADGYARASGRPGVCLAQMVGAGNLAAGLRDAYLGCSPVLAITGGPYAVSRKRNMYQENDDLSMFRSVTKFSTRVDTSERLADSMRQAFRSATSGKPGPVHLEFAGHFGEVVEQGEVDADVVVEDRFRQVPAFRPVADQQAIAEAARVLREATRPIIVAGGGVRASGAQRALLEVAEAFSIPVATSLNAKDTFPATHPLSVGVVGLYSRKSANCAVLESDLVFFIGSRTGSQVTHSWQVPPPGTPAVQLDIDPEELGRNYPNRVSLLGDARTTLEALREAAGGALDAAARKSWIARVGALVEEWRHEVAESFSSDAQPIRPERVCGDLSNLLPENVLLVSDTGHAGMWTGGMVDLKTGSGYIRTAGSLGWGFPASLGAQLALPDRPVVLFTGDGGFYYHLSELETAVRWAIPTITIVNNNRSLNQEVEVYEEAYGGALRGRHHELWHFNEIDFARVAQSLGARGIRVVRPAELAIALEQALAETRPTVIDVVTDIEAMAPLAFLPDTASSPVLG
jgi:acetolactate synthase I/II/III large subunit